MIFEFLIVYPRDAGDVRPILIDRLREALEDTLNDYDEEAIAQMIRPRLRRVGAEPQPGSDGVCRVVLGFALDLSEEATNPRAVVDEFTDALKESPIEHAVKFEDPLLQAELAEHAAELFAAEMKLRRALSAIYLAACDDRFYGLLREDTVRPMNPPQESQMKKAAENEFFFLTFSQYVKLNQRPEVSVLPKLLDMIRSHESFEMLKRELARKPVEHEDDAGFILALSARMDVIEKIRNCVAHNRRPPTELIDHYRNALPQLEEDLNRFLSLWAEET